MGLFVDAMSVHAAVTSTFVKTPAEKSLLCHVQFRRETLDRKTLISLIWIDTRDMVSDGLTKGAVSLVCAQEEQSVAPSRSHPSCRTSSMMSAPKGFHPLEAVVVPPQGGRAVVCSNQEGLYRCEGKTYRKKLSASRGVDAA